MSNVVSVFVCLCTYRGAFKSATRSPLFICCFSHHSPVRHALSFIAQRRLIQPLNALYSHDVAPFIYVFIGWRALNAHLSAQSSLQPSSRFQRIVHQYVNGREWCRSAWMCVWVLCLIICLISQWQLLMHLFNYLLGYRRIVTRPMAANAVLSPLLSPQLAAYAWLSFACVWQTRSGWPFTYTTS